MPNVLRHDNIEEAPDNDVDVELQSPSRLVGTHANVVPLSSNAQSARLFYAARFVNQEMPMVNREAPLVQALDPEDPDGKSFEEKFGERVGAKFFHDDDGMVESVTEDAINIKLPNGEKRSVGIYHNFPFNRKTAIVNKPLVKPGDHVKKGQILASSNYTDDAGTQSMGVNARVALVPYKGFSMDDAIVVSQSFADRMASEHSYEHDLEKDKDTKFGKTHYSSLFPTKFTVDQLDTLDENGVVKPGTVLHKGDPMILATRPKPVYSNAAHLGKLGKVFRSIRSDASEVWEHDYPGVVTDAVNGKKNAKVVVSAKAPIVLGDKIVIRNGQKGIVSKILSDEQILRGVDGKPFDVLLNPLSLPSRVNTATLYELALGKVAAKNGKPIKVPAYTKPGESRLAFVKKQLADAGLSPTEEVFDPVMHTKLERPVTTGVAYITKLHHVVESKQSARGNAGYDQNEQPLRGGSEQAQAKRLGGLETTALMAKGGYATIREGSTLRGQSHQNYWRLIRQGYKPPEPGAPFVFEKFKYLLNGAGLNARDLGNGRLRLGPMTDRDLAAQQPVEVKNGKMMDGDSLEGIAEGLFDPRMVALNKWGYIPLRSKLPNPAFEPQIAQMLGIKEKDMRAVIAGEMTMAEARERGNK